MLKSCTVTGRFPKSIAYTLLYLESWDGPCSSWRYRLLNMSERRPWCDFHNDSNCNQSRHDISLSNSDQIFFGLGVGLGKRVATKAVSNIKCDCMKAKAALISWLNCLAVTWVEEIQSSILFGRRRGGRSILYQESIFHGFIHGKRSSWKCWKLCNCSKYSVILGSPKVCSRNHTNP